VKDWPSLYLVKLCLNDQGRLRGIYLLGNFSFLWLATLSNPSQMMWCSDFLPLEVLLALKEALFLQLLMLPWQALFLSIST
jgi:hypothetical protein